MLPLASKTRFIMSVSNVIDRYVEDFFFFFLNKACKCRVQQKFEKFFCVKTKKRRNAMDLIQNINSQLGCVGMLWRSTEFQPFVYK